MKFFKKKPETCSICGLEKNIYKKGGAKGITLRYCKDCYDSYFEVVKARATAQIKEFAKSGRLIGMKEAKQLTNEIALEIEAEQAKKLEEGYKCPVCNYPFKTKEELEEHMISAHSTPEETIVPPAATEIKEETLEEYNASEKS